MDNEWIPLSDNATRSPCTITPVPKPEPMSASSDRSLCIVSGYIESVPASIFPSGLEKRAGVRVRPLTAGPPELEDLLQGRDDAGRAAAWKSFLEKYEPTILHTLRQIGEDPRDLKDRYASVLEQLAKDNFRCLREYSSDAQSSFTTWLCVVVHRMGTKHENRRNGQARSLVDLVAEHINARDRQALEGALRPAVSGSTAPQAAFRTRPLGPQDLYPDEFPHASPCEASVRRLV
jgi:DNA-directed RNA polymerase specialized sigma24 family protein